MSDKHEREDHVWRCDCKTNHFVSIVWDDWFADETEPDLLGYLEISADWQFNSLWARVKEAFRLVWRGDHCSGVVALTPEVAKEMVNALSKPEADDNFKKMQERHDVRS